MTATGVGDCTNALVLSPREALIFSVGRGGVWPSGGEHLNDGRVDSDQPSFTDIEYGNRRRVSRREEFLVQMDATIPWSRRER